MTGLHRKAKLGLVAIIVGLAVGPMSAFAIKRDGGGGGTGPGNPAGGECNGSEIAAQCAYYLNLPGGGVEACESCQSDKCEAARGANTTANTNCFNQNICH